MKDLKSASFTTHFFALFQLSRHSTASEKMYAKVPSCPALDDETRRSLAHRLFELGSLNFSGVQLKTGEVTPVYFDIRLTMSNPALLVIFRIKTHLLTLD